MQKAHDRLLRASATWYLFDKNLIEAIRRIFGRRIESRLQRTTGEQGFIAIYFESDEELRGIYETLIDILEGTL